MSRFTPKEEQELWEALYKEGRNIISSTGEEHHISEYNGTQTFPPSQEDCAVSEDGDHCAHWYNDKKCCHCKLAK